MKQARCAAAFALDFLAASRSNRYCHFGIKWFLVVAGASACGLALSAHIATIKNNRQYFLLVALIASYQERADATFARVVARVLASAIAATLGECRLATLYISVHM